ncbi:MAG: ATP-dependent protease ATPase subunit HslU [Candidatus Marinimicrobia bacterium]|nr:ATP-dependent protease ATPase subunit HslU [Candidatus Neomarinimicrobiota bacterium]
MKELTPRQIVKELDRYIVGQEAAKKSVAIAMRNRWRRLQVPDHLRDEIMPNNIILIGSTGVGKTEIARRLAMLTQAPFLKVEASKFTEVGYVGRDVESIIRDLTEVSVNMVRHEKEAGVKEQAQELANERLLDILFPVAVDKAPASNQGESVDEGEAEALRERHQRTREKLRVRLDNGEFEDRMVEIKASMDSNPVLQVMGPFGMDDIAVNLQEMFGNLLPKKPRAHKTTVAEGRKILAVEEAGKLIDMDEVIRDALQRVEQMGIVFVDELDKIAGEGHSIGPDVSREGVQRDILPIVEGCNVVTKYGVVQTDHILFIAAGAFHVSKPSDLIPELQGRFPIRVEMDDLTQKDFVKILTHPRNALIKQYVALLSTEGVKLTFDRAAINEIARVAYEVNMSTENIGARRLHTILTTLLEDILFEQPEGKDKTIAITKALVKEQVEAISKDQDLSRYIL